MPDLNSQAVPLYGRNLTYLNDLVIGQIPNTSTVGQGPTTAQMTPFPYGRGCSCIAGRYAHLDTSSGGLFDAMTGRFLTLADDGIDGTVAGLVADYGQARGIPGGDGTVMLARNFQTGGLRLACPDGTNFDVPGATFADYRQAGVLNKTQAVWRSTNNALTTCGGLAVPQVLPGATYYLQPMLLGGALWIGYLRDTQIVLHPFTSFQGYSFPGGFYPRFRVLDATHVAFVAAVDAADTPGAAPVIIDVTTTPTINLNPPITVSFSFNHPVFPAVFKDPTGATASPAEIVVNQNSQSANRPYFVAEDSLNGPFVGTRLGIYSEAVDPTQSLVTAKNTRLLLGHDASTAWPFPSGLRPWDIPGLEHYLTPGETPAQAHARVMGQMQTLLQTWPGDVLAIPMFYCEGGAPPNELFSVADVQAMLNLFSELVNLSPRIKVIAPFEYLRANGITGHPEFADALTALLDASAIAGVATLPAIDPVPLTPVPPLTLFAPLHLLKGTSMRVYVKVSGQFYTGINPTPATGKTGDAQFPVYYNRPAPEPNAGGAWEEAELTVHPDHTADVLYVAANRQLSIQNDGTLQSRAAGAIGLFETFQVRTEDGTGRNILYRSDLTGIVLAVEVKA